MRRKTLAQDDLKNVASADVLLGFPNGSEIFGPAEIGTHLKRNALLRLRWLFRALGRNRLFELPPRLLDFAHGSVVFRAQRTGAAGENIANDPQAVLHVIEGNDAVIEHEHRIVEADFVTQAFRQAFDQSNHVVAEIADGSGNERRQTRQPHGTETFDALT